MGKNATFDSDLLSLIFCGTPISRIADNAASSAFSNLVVSLHTADLTTSGDQTSNEASYTGYTRKTVARSTSGWAVSNNSVSPVSAVSFPQATSTSTSTITYAAVGTSTSGSGKVLYYGAISPVINISQNVTPIISTSTLISES
jgi:hypothetical protein